MCCYHRATVLVPPSFEIPKGPQKPLESYSISKIESGLFVGDMACVESEACLKFHNITAVISVACHSELASTDSLSPTHPLKKFDPKNRLTIRAGDIKSANLVKELPGVCSFISRHLSPFKPWVVNTDARRSKAIFSSKDGAEAIHDNKPAVLIHCRLGISRSATIAIGYLMWKHGKGRSATLEKVRQKRPCIRPNSSFLEQLSLWGRVGYELWEDAEHLVPKEDYVVLMDQLEAHKKVEEGPKGYRLR